LAPGHDWELAVLLLGLTLGVGWFALFVIVHVGLFHFRVVHRRSRAILVAFLCALGGEVLIAAVLGSDQSVLGEPTGPPAMTAVFATVIMLCGFVLYMPAYYTIATSLSVQTMISIHQAPGRSHHVADLKSVDVYAQLLEGRLASMVAAGNLVRDGDAYRLTRKGRLIARTFRAIKYVWRLGPGG
jgi:hypothetical protein